MHERTVSDTHLLLTLLSEIFDIKHFYKEDL
jgi:hypothetical protein